MKYISLMLLIIFSVSCSSKKNEDHKMTAQSIHLHNSMLRKANQIEHELQLMRTDSAFVMHKDSVEHLFKALFKWKSELVEVPGNDDHDHEGHDHSDHDHSRAAPDVTPEQMLEIQNDLDSSLSAIGKRVSALESL